MCFWNLIIIILYTPIKQIEEWLVLGLWVMEYEHRNVRKNRKPHNILFKIRHCEKLFILIRLSLMFNSYNILSSIRSRLTTNSNKSLFHIMCNDKKIWISYNYAYYIILFLSLMLLLTFEIIFPDYILKIIGNFILSIPSEYKLDPIYYQKSCLR